MHRPLGWAARLVYLPFALAWASAHCPARWAARLSQAVSALGLQPLEAASAPALESPQNQLIGEFAAL